MCLPLPLWVRQGGSPFADVAAGVQRKEGSNIGLSPILPLVTEYVDCNSNRDSSHVLQALDFHTIPTPKKKKNQKENKLKVIKTEH